MRNIQQRLASPGVKNQAQMFMFCLVVLVATGCAWDGKEMSVAQAAEVPAAAPQAVATQSMDIHKMFEIAKREAVVADLPVQF
ncbi:MAG: hypothetical protein JWP43_1330 [Ramlibacter sp.]|jgi:hypothetical protein|nr:hypothetical protein [Ramlibacter sp.]